MSTNRYRKYDLIVSRFSELNSSDRNEFGYWVRSLTLEQDNEIGGDGEGGTWRWVLEHNARRASASPFETFIFRTRYSNQIVATASFVQDDRGVAHQLGLDRSDNYLGLFGFFQVRREYRRQGIATLISQHMDKFVQRYVDSTKQAKEVYLFGARSYSIKTCERFGFVSTQNAVSVSDFNTEELLMKKTYRPRTTGRKLLDFVNSLIREVTLDIKQYRDAVKHDDSVCDRCSGR